MQQNDLKAEAILKALQERDKDHLLQLSLCNLLSQVTDRNGIAAVIKQLKEIIGFDAFVIAATNEDEREYSLFFHDNAKLQSEVLETVYSVQDGFFDVALKSAESINFNLTKVNVNKNCLPEFIQQQHQLAMQTLVVFPLHYHKNNPSVLFIFFKNANKFTNQAQRLLKSLSMQMALTISNILLIKKIELYYNSPLNATANNLSQNNSTLSSTESDYSGIVGQGEAMQKVIKLVKHVAKSDCGVLLLGESGTGKEVIANTIHKNSVFNTKEMICVNCAAIPFNLIESELFGHEKGSFTGATEARVGKFELANNTTLFLDEIGEMPLALQTKLLRALQEKEFERIGGTKTIKVNVRIIAATNLNLQHEVAMGRFRSDLYYRLNIFPIALPALRDRKEDIPVLSAHFVNDYCKMTGRAKLTIAAKVLKAMAIYHWPGNVRELKNCLERSILLTTGNTITEIYLPETINTTTADESQHIKTLKEVEKEYILTIIKLCNGRLSGPNGAAKKLGIPSTTLASKMQRLGITKKHSFKL